MPTTSTSSTMQTTLTSASSSTAQPTRRVLLSSMIYSAFLIACIVAPRSLEGTVQSLAVVALQRAIRSLLVLELQLAFPRLSAHWYRCGDGRVGKTSRLGMDLLSFLFLVICVGVGSNLPPSTSSSLGSLLSYLPQSSMPECVSHQKITIKDVGGKGLRLDFGGKYVISKTL